jgi:hypothetical protein
MAIGSCEVATGFEPVYTALQAVASPLGHATASPRSDPLRADDGIRTRDPHLGKVMRYQLRYVRNARLTGNERIAHGRTPDQNRSAARRRRLDRPDIVCAGLLLSGS